MEISLEHKNSIVLEIWNTLIHKMPFATPLLGFVWFGDRLLLFITPGEIEGWVKLGFTVLMGLILAFYTIRKWRIDEKGRREKHKKEMEQLQIDLNQDKMNYWLDRYENAITKGIITKDTPPAEYIKQLEKIEALASQTTNK